MKLILASKSPRRKDILGKHGYTFTVQVAPFNEISEKDQPIKTAEHNAFGKAKATFDSLKDSNAVVLGSDTVVCIDGEILGKPTDCNDAVNMLKRLSNKTHQVVTGFAIITKDFEIKGHDKSLVTFNNLSNELIEEYIASGLPLDKAGAYGIQDGYPLVKKYTGSFNNIVGLPIEIIKPILDKILK